MTNIEKVKRILDAGHWVKVTYEDSSIMIVTSYIRNSFSVYSNEDYLYVINKPTFDDWTIEVIQRIPTPYKAGDKVLVLSNPEPDNEEKDALVWKVCEIYLCGAHYQVWDTNKSYYWTFPTYSLAPAFEEDSLSGKEAKVTIDGKEYSVTLKLI